MRTSGRLLVCTIRILLVIGGVLAGTSVAVAQVVPPPNPNPNPWGGGWNNQAVGGISIDANGALHNATLDALGQLHKLRAEALAPVPGQLGRTVPLRKVSLRLLTAEIQKCIDQGKPLPDEMKCLAGLQQIRYVFVYPQQHDIVLAGPAEGWKVDARGYLVGTSTGRPVMLLDDLLVALRSAGAAAQGGISCSIDPTPEGLTRLKQHVARLRTIGDPQQTAGGIEQALGPQRISFGGVPAESHFARVLLAADYRMKRLAMNFEPSPVPGLPSFLQLISATGRGMSNLLPRWWLTPEYQPLRRDADGLAWELSGATVKAMTEEDLLTPGGGRQHTGRASPAAERWAEDMTRQYDRLALAEPSFGQLRNCADLAVAAALIVHENLPQRADCDLSLLLSPTGLKTAEFPVPRQVDSKASLLKKGTNWLIGASGGVRFHPRAIISKTETSDKLAPVRDESALAVHENWWWN